MIQRKESEIKVKRSLSTTITLVIALIAIWLAFSFLSPYFFSISNIINLLRYSSVMGIASAGVLIVIISGGIDLSVGSIVALTGMIAAWAISYTGNWYMGIIAGILTSLICGAINATLITFVRIAPLIAGLGTMTIFGGCCYLVNNALSISIKDNTYKYIGQGNVFGVPIIIIIMILTFIIIGLVLKYTTFGRQVYSIGGNSQASYLAGINIKKARFKLYLLSGLLSGVAGICLSSMTGTATPSAARDLTMVDISAVILGGASLAGGSGSIIGTVIGIVMLGTISNALTLLNLSQYYQDIVRGAILILAVSLDAIKGKGAYK